MADERTMKNWLGNLNAEKPSMDKLDVLRRMAQDGILYSMKGEKIPADPQDPMAYDEKLEDELSSGGLMIRDSDRVNPYFVTLDKPDKDDMFVSFNNEKIHVSPARVTAQDAEKNYLPKTIKKPSSPFFLTSFFDRISRAFGGKGFESCRRYERQMADYEKNVYTFQTRLGYQVEKPASMKNEERAAAVPGNRSAAVLGREARERIVNGEAETIMHNVREKLGEEADASFLSRMDAMLRNPDGQKVQNLVAGMDDRALRALNGMVKENRDFNLEHIVSGCANGNKEALGMMQSLSDNLAPHIEERSLKMH